MDLIDKINLINHDQEELKNIEELQKAFNNVKENCRKERDHNLREAVDKVKEKLKNNPGISKVVESFVAKYIQYDLQESAEEDLYDMLAAEYLETLNAMTHTLPCIIS